MIKCPYCLQPYLNVNPAHLVKHDKRLEDVYAEFPGLDIGKTSKGARLGIPLKPEHRRKISEAQKGKFIPYEQRLRHSKFMKGRPSPLKGRKKTMAQRILNSAVQQGITVEEWTDFAYNRTKDSIAKSPFWRELRLKVKYRDEFRCGECRLQFQGKELEVHHIIPRRENSSLAFEDTNCITLCKPCHRKITWREHIVADKYFILLASRRIVVL